MGEEESLVLDATVDQHHIIMKIGNQCAVKINVSHNFSHCKITCAKVFNAQSSFLFFSGEYVNFLKRNISSFLISLFYPLDPDFNIPNCFRVPLPKNQAVFRHFQMLLHLSA